MPHLVTHKALVDGNLENALFWATSFERTCVKPLSDAGLLGCVLLQLSPYFKNEGSTLGNLKGLLDALPTHEHNYAVEFRHRSWLDESRKEMGPATLEALRERNVANVLLDGPCQPVTEAQTADHAYVHFHGRNADIWYGQEKEDDHRLNRYDYLYNKEQLDPWVPHINEATVKANKVRVYFNNHARAKAIKNAFQLMDMLLGEHKRKVIKLQDQFKLSEF